MIGFPEAVFGHVPQPPRCLACEGARGVAAGPRTPPGIGEAALRSPAGTGQGNPCTLVSSEDRSQEASTPGRNVALPLNSPFGEPSRYQPQLALTHSGVTFMK